MKRYGMAKKRGIKKTSQAKSVTPERAARLYRWLQLLERGPLTRTALIKKLRLDVRGFYRDLELLRDSGIRLSLIRKVYYFQEKLSAAVCRLPFPDPHLTFEEAFQLSKGRTPAHQKLKVQIARIMKS